MIRKTARALTFALACAAAATLAACGGGGGPDSSAGRLTLGITDAPIDVAQAVVVSFTGVELKPVNGSPISVDFAAPKIIDLYLLQGDKRELLLAGEQVPAGEYEWMRLKVAADPSAQDTYLQVNDQQCELRIPSGAETGLKLIHSFKVGVGAITDLTIDFDLRKSIVQPPGQRSEAPTCGSGQAYLLKPVLKVVDTLKVGTITGKVYPLPDGCADVTNPIYPGNVYLFGPYDETAPLVDDFDGVDDAIASARVDRDTFRYTIGFVPEGDYVISYTCSPDDVTVDADTDQPTAPAVDEIVTFEPDPGHQITVFADQSTTVDFPVPAP